MKRLFLLIIIFFTFMTACNKQKDHTDNNPVSSAQKESIAEYEEINAELETFQFEDAIENADLIAEVVIQDKVSELKEGPMPQTVFNATISEILLGNPDLTEIKVMQQGGSNRRFNGNALFLKMIDLF